MRRAIISLVTAAFVLLAAPAWADCSSVGRLLGTCTQDPSPPGRTTSGGARASERRALELLAGVRDRAGLRSLTVSPAARAIAREHARAMRRAGRAFHSRDLGSSATRGALGYPRALAENVGFGPTARAVHAAFMRSPEHRVNMLGRAYDHVGIGAASDGHNVWITIVFTGGGDDARLPGGGTARGRRPRGAEAWLPVLPDSGDVPRKVSAGEPPSDPLPLGAMLGVLTASAVPGAVRLRRTRARRG